MTEQDVHLLVKNIVVVGDGNVGKTCLLHKYTDGKFLTDYIPTIYDKDAVNVELDNNTYSVKLHDTAGQEDFERLRHLAYNDADVFLLCYSVDNLVSYDNVFKKWAPELKRRHENIPVILVATKIDLRSTTDDCISTMDGEKLKKQINANGFIECSAKEFINIQDVFTTAIRSTIKKFTEEKNNDGGNWCCCCFKLK